MRDNWRKECCRDLVVPCADTNADSILYIILFSTSDCITVCHIWLPVIRKNKWLQFQTVRQYKFTQNNQPESQYRQCTRPAGAFALSCKSPLCSACWCPFWCENLKETTCWMVRDNPNGDLPSYIIGADTPAFQFVNTRRTSVKAG